MDYIHGTVASELRVAKTCAPGLFGTPDQDRKFRQQMADIQVELSLFEFNHIGSLYQDDKTSDFFIGPEVETGKGPWVSSADYYNDSADHALQVCLTDARLDVRNSPSFVIPIVFKHLISLSCYDTSKGGPFSLTNRDFGAHNLLVNDDFEIVGMIDFDGIIAAPIEVVAQYPALTGLDRPPPGHVETKPLALDRIKRTESQLKEYQSLIEIAEAGKAGGRNAQDRIADKMLSDAASVYQGLQEYASHQKFVNEDWMEAYLKLLHMYVLV